MYASELASSLVRGSYGTLIHMNNSKTTTVLLVIIIVLLAVGLYVLMGKKQNNAPVVDESQSMPDVQKNVIKSTTSTTPAWSKVSEESGMSVMIPEGYATSTLVPNALLGHAVALNVTYNEKNVISIIKFSTQNLYNDSTPHGMADDRILINSNYPISGTTGLYYDNQGAFDHYIIVPSKLVTIYIDALSLSGISQITLDKMLASIQL